MERPVTGTVRLRTYVCEGGFFPHTPFLPPPSYLIWMLGTRKDLLSRDVLAFMTDVKIQNIVASTTIAHDLDLDRIARSIPSTSYNPGIFPGLVLRIAQPKVAFLLFRSGKVICTGAKTIEDITAALQQVEKRLRKADLEVVKKPQITVQNIVASGDLHGELNLTSTALAVGL